MNRPKPNPAAAAALDDICALLIGHVRWEDLQIWLVNPGVPVRLHGHVLTVWVPSLLFVDGFRKYLRDQVDATLEWRVDVVTDVRPPNVLTIAQQRTG